MLILIANGPLKITKDYKNVQKIKKNINIMSLKILTYKLSLESYYYLKVYTYFHTM